MPVKTLATPHLWNIGKVGKSYPPGCSPSVLTGLCWSALMTPALVTSFPCLYSSLCFPWKPELTVHLACKLPVLSDPVIYSLKHPPVRLSSWSLHVVSLFFRGSAFAVFSFGHRSVHPSLTLLLKTLPCLRLCSKCYF